MPAPDTPAAPPDPPKRPRVPPPLSARAVRFAQLIVLEGKKATPAYLEAGYPAKATDQATRQAARRLVTNRHIRAYVGELRAAAMDAAKVNATVMAAALSRMAFGHPAELCDEHGRLLPPHLWPPGAHLMVEGLKQEQLYERDPRTPGRRVLIGYQVEVKQVKRVPAATLLARLTGLIRDTDPNAKGAAEPLVVGGEADPDKL